MSLDLSLLSENDTFAAVFRAAERLKLRRHLFSCSKADYLEKHPAEALTSGKEQINCFINGIWSENRFVFQWQEILETWPVAEICALLRDNSDETEQLRLSAPAFRILPKAEKDQIFDAVYGDQEVF